MENLNSYYNFYVVAKTGNISNAAKQLFVSQPALSKSITRLEEAIGVNLFYRTSRGVSLTEEGQVIFSYVEKAFDNLSKGEEALKKINELGIGHIRIGVSTSLCKHILLGYLKDFIHDNPNIKVSIDCHSTLNTLKLLERDEIDIGLICNTNLPNGMIYEPVKEIHDVLVASPDYIENMNIRSLEDDQKTPDNITNLDGIIAGNIAGFLTTGDEDTKRTNPDINTKAILAKSTLMVLEEANVTRNHIDRYFLSENIECSQILEINNMDLLIDFAAIGMGVAAVVREFAESYLTSSQIIELPLAHPIPKRTVGFVFSENKKQSTVLKKFMDYIR